MNGYPYFVVSELGLSKVDYTAELKDEYNSIAESLVAEAYQARLGAETFSLTANAQEALVLLQAKYDALFNAKRSVYGEQLDALMEEHVKTGLGYPKQTSAEYIALLEATTVEEFNAALPAYKSCDDIEVPQPGTFLRIKAIDGWNDDAPYLGSKNSSGNSRAEYVAEADASTIFYFDGAQLVSYGSGNYLVDNSDFLGYSGVKPSGAKFTFHAAANDKFGACNISFQEDGRWLYVNKDNYTDAGSGTISTGGEGYCFNLEAVTSIPVNVTAVGYASFYSPVAVALPEGVEAYAVSSHSDKYASMQLLENDVIPAHTGVILKLEEGAEAGNYQFGIVEETNGQVSNELRGTVASAYIQGSAYVLSMQDGVVGFYKAMLNFTVADNGTVTKVTENGTHFLNNGFRAYLPVGGNNARSLVFDFGGTETGIVETENGKVKTENPELYDLAGRRVLNAKKGVFVVNGKVIVK